MEMSEVKTNPWDLLRSAWAAGRTLPRDSAERKLFPVRSGCVEYIPAALVAFAYLSRLGNEKHNPGEELHHARSKSTDHADCLMRHEIDQHEGDRLEELTCAFWRAGLELQLYAESLGAPKAPRAK